MFIGHVCPPHSTYTAPMPLPAGSVHAHILSSLSRAGLNRKETKLLLTRIVIFRGLIDEMHAQRRLPSPGLVCPAAAVTTATTAVASAFASVASVAASAPASAAATGKHTIGPFSC